MKQAMLLLFPVSEYEKRIQALLAGMERENLDAVILTSDENTYYFSGFRSIVWDSKVSTPAALILLKDGQLLLATSEGGQPTAEATSCAEEFRTYGPHSYADYVAAMLSPLAEKNLLKGRIGFGLGAGHKMHLNHSVSQALFAALSGAEIVDIADLLWRIRGIKSPLEIEKLRKSCEINCAAIDYGFNHMREGMTEMDLYGLIMSEYFRLGAERALPIGLRAGAERYAHSNCPPGYRPVKAGDIILIDGGPVYHGYYSDIIREAVIGRPTAEQQEMFDVAREAAYRGLEAVKPGVPLKEISRVVDDFMDSSKFAAINMYKGWCGHGIGVGVHEYPMIDAGAETVLQPGMCFAIEPYLFKAGLGSLGIEENFCVTESGYELLTPLDSALRRL